MARTDRLDSFYEPPISEADIAAVVRVLRSGWLTSGPVAREFEETVARTLGVRGAVGVSSGTIGLQTALEAFEFPPRTEVATTPMTFAATAEAIVRAGHIPRFCDVAPDSLNLDPVAVERRLTRKTRAVIPVGVGGTPCDMTAFRTLSRRHKLAIIEDAAHTLGAEFKGRPIGRWADATVFSFYATKNITTGEGGMIVSNNRRFIERCRLLSLHGITRPAYRRQNDRSRRSYEYDVAALGLKANLSDLSAALGLSQWKRLDALTARRRKILDWYRRALRDCDWLDWPRVPDGAAPSGHLCQILLRTEALSISRDQIIDLLAARGVPCGVHFIPLYRMSFYRKTFGLRAGDFPRTEAIHPRILSLPLYPALRQAQVARVCEILIDICEKHRR